MDFDLARIEGEASLAEVEFHDEIGSTNDRALDCCRDPVARTPRLILAERQTKGRGRGTHRWWSNAGALTFSLVYSDVDLPLPFENWSLISLIAGLAAAESIAESMADAQATDLVRVKWPNDVYCGERKIAGLLCEIPAMRPPCLVLGIGLNVNNSLREAPDELSRSATSLADETGCMHDRTELLIRLLGHIDRQLHEVGSSGPDRLLQSWSQRSLLQGKLVTHDSGENRLRRGLCLGIDPRGALLLETDAGTERLLGGTIVDWESI